MKFFTIVTFVRRREQYEQFRATCTRAGLDEFSNYIEFDNTVSNNAEPYSALNQVLASADTEYVVECHEDVRIPPSSTGTLLTDQLQALSCHDPDWAIAGNAGVDEKIIPAFHLDDPSGRFRCKNLPRRVLALDENFLVIRTSSEVRLSRELSGFHFYGADLCLNALERGLHSYVIDYPLVHLSSGDHRSAEFKRLAKLFASHWSSRIWIASIATTCTRFLLGRNILIRFLFWLPPFILLRFGGISPVFRLNQLPKALFGSIVSVCTYRLRRPIPVPEKAPLA